MAKGAELANVGQQYKEGRYGAMGSGVEIMAYCAYRRNANGAANNGGDPSQPMDYQRQQRAHWTREGQLLLKLVGERSSTNRAHLEQKR